MYQIELLVNTLRVYSSTHVTDNVNNAIWLCRSRYSCFIYYYRAHFTTGTVVMTNGKKHFLFEKGAATTPLLNYVIKSHAVGITNVSITE